MRPIHLLNRKKTSRAFSLLELSLVVGIIALIIGMSVQSMRNVMASAQMSATQIEMKQIEKALQSYWEINGRLPCPGVSVGVEVDDANYGDEAADPAVCTGTDTADGVSVGMVPFHTLNLPATMAEDGWYTRYTYAVATSYTGISSAKRVPREAVCSAISVVDAEADARTNNAIYVLVSHGANKLGAVLRTGIRNDSTGVHPDEATNINPTLSDAFVSRIPEGGNTGSYDDLVSFRSRWNINPNEPENKNLNIGIDQLFVSLDQGASPYIYMFRWNGNLFQKSISVMNDAPTEDIDNLAASGASDFYSYLFAGNGSGSNTMYIRTGDFYEAAGTPPATPDNFNAAAFSKQGDFIAYATEDGPKLQSISDTTLTDVSLTGTALTAESTSVAFSPNGKYLAVGMQGADKVVMYERDGSTFNRATSGQLDVDPAGNITDVAFSPDGRYFAVSYDAAPYISIYAVSYTADSFTRVSTSTALDSVANSVSFASNSGFLAVGHDADPYITVYSLDEASGSLTLTELDAIDSGSKPSGPVNEVSFSNQGLFLAVAIQAASDEPSASVYEIRNNMDIIRLPALPLLPTGETALSITFSPK